MFNSQTYGKLNIELVVDKLLEFYKRIKQYDTPIQIIIGTDSQNHSETKIVTVIAITCEGHGGIYFYEVNYLNRIDKLMGKKRFRSDKSAYAYLSSMGYSALGDYDESFERAQNITVRSHMPEYYKRAADYYINKGDLEKASESLSELSELGRSITSPVYRDQILIFVKGREYMIRVKEGILDGAEEFYSELYEQCDDQALIVRVSVSYTLGNIILQKGDRERALPYLKFASENGGDTKYKKLSDGLLAKIS